MHDNQAARAARAPEQRPATATLARDSRGFWFIHHHDAIGRPARIALDTRDSAEARARLAEFKAARRLFA